MDALQQAILLNRYAKRDVLSTPKIGDTVLVITDKNTSFQELGTVVSVSDSDVTVQLADSLYTTPHEFVDILVETTPADIWNRVANAVAEVEPENESYWSTQFRHILDDWKFVPGGRILAGMGASQNLTAYNCFTLPNPKDSRQGIMDTLAAMTDIMARGGGVGINISSLRPRNAVVEKVNGRSSGAVSWASLFSFTTGLIEQGGKRRGAGIQILEDWHPDIIEFINIKRTSGKMTNSNISVGVSDAFMHAVENDLEWVLRFPDTTYPNYDELWDGDLKKWESHGLPVIEYQRLKARDMWNMIIESAWACAEPGLWFIDRANHYSNGYYFSRLVSTNPCITGDTKVLTTEGEIEIRELHNRFVLKQPLPKLITDKRLESNKVLGQREIYQVVETGVKPVFELKLSNASSVKLTAEHMVMTARGWIQTKYLQLDDLVYTGDYIHNESNAGLSSIQSITRLDRETAYDLTEPITHSFIGNGIVLHNCGEIGLTGWAVCNLGAINLSKFWDNGVLWDELGETVELAVRFLDNVVDRTPYFLSENERVQKDERRLGLNTMGLADLFIKAGIRYGSQESLDFIDELYTFIRDRAYQTSAELAKEKGSFPKYDRDKVSESNFIKTLPLWLQDEIYEKGLRNVAIMTQAPNGSTGSLVGVSTGIEPHFAFSYHRKSRLGEFEQHAEIVREWKEANPDQPLPSYFVTAMDLTPEEHVLVMAQIQKYVDQSISKSCNLPNSYTVEDTGKIYQLMYKLGCKGGTVYRDGSRDEQVLNLKKEEPAKAEFKAEKRPDLLNGKTLSVKTSFGTVYVTINEIQPNQPFEVFVSVGKGGSDLEADSEGLGRLASLVLRSTPDKKQALTEIIAQLEGIGGANPYGMGKKRILSLPDAVAHCLKKYMGKLEEVVETPIKASGSGLDLCPSCHNMTLLREDGCKKCLNCEYSAC